MYSRNHKYGDINLNKPRYLRHIRTNDDFSKIYGTFVNRKQDVPETCFLKIDHLQVPKMLVQV